MKRIYLKPNDEVTCRAVFKVSTDGKNLEYQEMDESDIPFFFSKDYDDSAEVYTDENGVYIMTDDDFFLEQRETQQDEILERQELEDFEGIQEDLPFPEG